MSEAGMDEELERALIKALATYMQQLPRGQQGCPLGFTVNYNSPVTITINAGQPRRHSGWLAHALHLIESSSVRIAVFIIGIATLIVIVKYKLGYI